MASLSQFCDAQKTRIKRRLNGEWFMHKVMRARNNDLEYQRMLAWEDCDEIIREEAEVEYRRGPALAVKRV
jgi:hypothetical protein